MHESNVNSYIYRHNNHACMQGKEVGEVAIAIATCLHENFISKVTPLILHTNMSK